MPLRLRGGLRNTVPRILVQPSSSALISAFALRTLTPNKHIPFISTLRISFRFGCGCPTQSKHQADNLAKLRLDFLSVIEPIAKIFGAVSRTISLMRLSALLASKRCRCRDDGFCSCYLARFLWIIIEIATTPPTAIVNPTISMLKSSGRRINDFTLAVNL